MTSGHKQTEGIKRCN